MVTCSEGERQLLEEMQNRNFPKSVIVTVVWATRKAPDSTQAVTEVMERIKSGATPKEMTRFVQPILRDSLTADKKAYGGVNRG